MIVSLMEAAIDYYTRQTRQEVPDYVRVTWAKFLRKWLAFKGELLPDLYHLVSAARSAMDEDFGYHVHEFLSDYAWSNDPFDPSAVLLERGQLDVSRPQDSPSQEAEDLLPYIQEVSFEGRQHHQVEGAPEA